MKIRRIAVLIVGVMILCGSMAGYAQEKQEQAPFLLIAVDTIKPAGISDYFKYGKEFKALYQEHKVSFPVMIFNSESFKTAFVIPLEKMGSLDDIIGEAMKLRGAVGEEKMKEMDEQVGATMDFSTSIIAAHRPELAYMPEDPAYTFDPQKACFTRVDTYYVMPGKEKELEEFGKKALAMYKEKGTTVAMSCFQTVIGSELPTYLIIMSAATEEELDEQLSENGKKLGQEYRDMINPVLKIVRKVETEKWNYSPEMSYFPGMKSEETDSKDEDTEKKSEEEKE